MNKQYTGGYASVGAAINGYSKRSRSMLTIL